MQIQSYEDLFYVYEKYLKSKECKTLNDAKAKFKKLLYEYYDTEEEREIEEHMNDLDEKYTVNTEMVNGRDCDGTPYNE